MRLKDLFTVPEGEKVTERHLRRVLVSSICSILLCMSCLVSTTWAWFTVSIENTGNVIQVASMPRVSVTVNTERFDSGPVTIENNGIVNIENASDPDDVQQKSTLYVTISINNAVQGYVMLDSSNSYKASITIETDASCSLSWTASWFVPDAVPLNGDAINLVTEEETGSVDGTTDPTDTTASTEATVPAETTIPTETTAPTETTVPAETTIPTEPTAPTETTTPTETTDPTQTTESLETTAPTEFDTTPTEDAAPPESTTSGDEP